MTRHDDDSFESSLGVVLRRALRQQVEPETRDRHLDALTVQAGRLRDGAAMAEVVPLRPARPRWMAGAAAALVVLAFGSTTVVASQDALPGDVLYTVKRGTENARLFLATSPEAVAEVRADIAQTRSEEAQIVAAVGGPGAEEQVETLQAEARSQLERAAEEDPGAPGIPAAQERVEQDIEGSDELLGGTDTSPSTPVRPAAPPTTAPSEAPAPADPPVAVVPGPAESGTAETQPSPTPSGDPVTEPPAGGGGSVIPSTQD